MWDWNLPLLDLPQPPAKKWVQCDLCEAQHHQICALLNGGINDGQQAGYNCARCYIQKHKTLPQGAVLGAKDLPTTNMSDYIEKRLFRRLEQERQERAMREQKKKITQRNFLIHRRQFCCSTDIVYHEILIGYLEYCKKRGFTSRYIWVFPPKEGDEYIWYCHPKSQKSPRIR
ncbi:hypothetical protein K1719_027779 [Acacia pycnantha]|nr:hypothetical protein K1719_027779 [Acacia pycnantha]